MFKNMCSEYDTYQIHIQVGEHVIHLHSDDTGFEVLYNILKDLKVALIRFSQLDNYYDFCFKY